MPRIPIVTKETGLSNLRVDRTVTITAQFTARQWELYDSEGVDAIANSLNRKLQHVVNMGKTRHEVMQDMLSLMFIYREHGAYDSEPLHFLRTVLDEIYGEEA